MVSHYNVQRTIDMFAGTQGRDLGSVASDIAKITAAAQKKLPKRKHMVTRGQVSTMRSSFIGLGAGLAFAIVLVYLLIVVNFQSWSGSVHHHYRSAGCSGGNLLDVVLDPHHAERARADGKHHEHGCRDGEQRPGH